MLTQLQTLEFAAVTAGTVLQFTDAYREAQQINVEVVSDHPAPIAMMAPGKPRLA